MTAPAPLTPPGCDLRDFPFMPIDISRLLGSEFHAMAGDTAWRAGVTLWLRSWHQVPAGSLPDNDIALARLAELGSDLKTWRTIKDAAMRGWEKCSDGRLYHRVVAEKALEAWIEKLLQRVSSAAGNAKRWGMEADIDGINQQISDASRLLTAIAPQSRALPKLQRRQSRSAGIGNPTGTPTGNPTGTPETIPAQSQETGTGTGTGTGIINNDCLIERAGAQSEFLEEGKGGTDAPAVLAMEQVCSAAGFVLTDDTWDRSLAIVKGWLDQGIDLDATILPTIRDMLPGLTSPTSSLSRFTKSITHAHAQRQATPQPPAPVFEFTGEPSEMVAVRRSICQRLGEQTYTIFAGAFRLEPIPEQQALRIIERGPPVFDGARVKPIQAAAAEHGFTDVWRQ
jgi:hypothetical protein